MVKKPFHRSKAKLSPFKIILFIDTCYFAGRIKRFFNIKKYLGIVNVFSSKNIFKPCVVVNLAGSKDNLNDQ